LPRGLDRHDCALDLERPDGGEQLIELVQRHIIFVGLKLLFHVGAAIASTKSFLTGFCIVPPLYDRSYSCKFDHLSRLA
jgi:hypothetical protein